MQTRRNARWEAGAAGPDEAAVERLVTEHDWIVTRQRLHAPPPWTEEDLHQEGRIALLAAARRYMPTPAGATFATYAWAGVRGAMIDALSRWGRGPATVSIASGTDGGWAESIPDYKSECSVASSAGSELLFLALRCLQGPGAAARRNKRLFLDRAVLGLTLDECAERHQITRQRAHQILRRLAEKVRAAMGGGGPR